MAKTEKQVRGAEGEELAASYLMRQGCRVLARNYRSGRGEIDIIAEDGPLVVFIEVKTRASLRYGYPEESVKGVKKALFYAASEAWLRDNRPRAEYRFDIISVLVKSFGEPEIFHIKDAFGGEMGEI